MYFLKCQIFFVEYEYILIGYENTFLLQISNHRYHIMQIWFIFITFTFILNIIIIKHIWYLLWLIVFKYIFAYIFFCFVSKSFMMFSLTLLAEFFKDSRKWLINQSYHSQYLFSSDVLHFAIWNSSMLTDAGISLVLGPALRVGTGLGIGVGQGLNLGL